MSKENVIKSKIPIPVDPLPPLSEFTRTKKRIVKNEQHPRHPLETLYQEDVNLESASLNYRKNKKGLRRSNSALTKIDTQHVTIRKNNEDLDWNYNVFKDNSQDDDDNNKGALEAHTHKDSHLGESRKISTPALKTLSNLEPSRIRNIKRSLKRPHSRELVGISPAVSDDIGEEKHRRRLVFGSTSDCLAGKSQSNETWLNSYASSYNQDYGPDLFNYLLMRETVPQKPRITSSGRSLIMNWLVKVNGRTGNPAALQTAAWYFDAVLSVSEVPVDQLQVLAAACYWIALKIHGAFRSAKKMVIIGANAYSAELLISAEKAVLKKLEFPIQPIVAQDFISYLSWVCDSCNYEEIESTATLLHMAGLVVHKSLTLNYPSVLAAAAMCNALKLLGKKELLVKLEKNFVYKKAVKKVKKESNFVDICMVQTDALSKMTSPRFEYQALLEKAKDPTLTEKILTSLKYKKMNATYVNYNF